jgi:hypothetical protein
LAKNGILTPSENSEKLPETKKGEKTLKLLSPKNIFRELLLFKTSVIEHRPGSDLDDSVFACTLTMVFEPVEQGAPGKGVVPMKQSEYAAFSRVVIVALIAIVLLLLIK